MITFSLVVRWALPIVAIVLILFTRSSIKEMQESYAWVSPLERIMNKGQRRAFKIVVVLSALGWLLLSQGILILASNGQVTILSLIMIGGFSLMLSIQNSQIKLFTVNVHAAFDSASVCTPEYMQYAIARYTPKKDVAMRVAPMAGGKQVMVTIGEHFMRLILPTRLSAEEFLLRSVVAAPPRILGYEINWEITGEDVGTKEPISSITTNLILPPQEQPN